MSGANASHVILIKTGRPETPSAVSSANCVEGPSHAGTTSLSGPTISATQCCSLFPPARRGHPLWGQPLDITSIMPPVRTRGVGDVDVARYVVSIVSRTLPTKTRD